MSDPRAPLGAADTILCDTSFVSVVQARGVLRTWPAQERDRLDAAVLAISVVTLAELRDGHIYG
jgi:predicted nucleic acid-binding protein